MRNDGKSSIQEMGHTRSDMTELVKARRDSVQEHIWKLIAYWSDRPHSIDSWLTTLNAFIKEARIYNRPRGRTRPNMSMAQLVDQIAEVGFENFGDVEVLNSNWHHDGYPLLPDAELEKTRRQCVDLSIRLCSLVMMDTGPMLTRMDVEISRSRET